MNISIKELQQLTSEGSMSNHRRVMSLGSSRTGSRRAGWALGRRQLVSWNSQRSGSEEDEEELKWAAIERLPTYDRLRKGLMLKHVLDEQGKVGYEEDDI